MRLRTHQLPMAIVAFAMIRCGHGSLPLPAIPPDAKDSVARVERGRYLVRDVAVCGGCHSAEQGKPDGALSGGHEFRDWRIGVARASNLTPDESGLGSWSEAEIVRAIRNGVRRDGRLLAPVMPYAWLSGLSDEDAFAIAAYLKSLPPVPHQVRQEFNVAFKFAGVLILRPKAATMSRAPAAAADAAYGSYLSQHAGLCGECHTPRGGIQATADRSRLFAGDPHPPKDFPAHPANLTPDAETGIGKWSDADFVRTIRTGTDPAGVRLHPFMPWHENARMTDDDLLAISRFLHTLPAIHDAVPRRASP